MILNQLEHWVTADIHFFPSVNPGDAITVYHPKSPKIQILILCKFVQLFCYVWFL